MDTIRFAIRALQMFRTARAAWHGVSEALGHEEHPVVVPGGTRTRQALVVAGLVGGGVVVGVGIGLLVAPTSGRELRERLVERTRRHRPDDDSQNGRSTWPGD